VLRDTAKPDELVLGFTIPTSIGDLGLDLGKASDVGVGGTSVVDLNAHGNVGLTAAALLAQLNSLYGNMNRLTWGVVGGHVANANAAAIYSTVPHGAQPPLLGAPGNLNSAINTVGTFIDGTGTPPNQQVVDPTAGFGVSWTEQIASTASLWQKNATDPDSTTPSTFSTGGLKYQMADLYLKTYTGGVGNAPVYQGFFTLGNDGSLTFTPASIGVVVPSV